MFLPTVTDAKRWWDHETGETGWMVTVLLPDTYKPFGNMPKMGNHWFQLVWMFDE